MRRLICLAALVVALWGATTAAQTIPFGNSTTVKNTRLSAATQQKNIGPSTFLGAPFRLRDLFGRQTPPFSNRNPVGFTKVPTPGTEEYLKAFGYKRLF
jgi:hypothetical protein